MPGTVKVERSCETCGKPFMVLRRTLNRKGEGRFCSRPCASVYACRRRNEKYPQAGAGNNNWKGGVSLGSHVRYTNRFIAKFPEKARAQRLLKQAVKAGRIVRPGACSECWKVCKPHGHHDDYTKPYTVRWLCQQCHNAHHAELRRKEKAA